MQNVAVVGDVAIDWFEEVVPSVALSVAPEEAPNHLLRTGFRWHVQLGGAYLLGRFVDSALQARGIAAEIATHPAILPTNDNESNYLQSLADLIISGREPQVCRVDQPRGFTTPKNSPRTTLAPLPGIDTADVLVVDDAANGARWDEKFLDWVRRLLATARLVAIKMSRPLEPSPLIKLVAGYQGRTVIVINADDLRAQGVDISRRLSWERTAVDIVRAWRGETALRTLCGLADVCVRLDCDGCVVFERDRAPQLLFDPTGSEGGFVAGLVGSMPGGTAAFTAGLVAELMAPQEGPDPAIDLGKHARALAASRALQDQGFARTEGGDFEYPRRLFDGVGSDAFATAELPPKANTKPDHWSILSEALERVPELPQNVVRSGRTLALRVVPTARYNALRLVDRREIEGFRSIENLLREYQRSTAGKPSPISIGVFGPPGSGKSFGLKELARTIGPAKIEIETFNLTQFYNPQELSAAFHFARDVNLHGKLPMLIFDEFDSNFEQTAFGWLKYFLAPMQDGEFKEEGRQHPIGWSIFVFAGGVCHSYEDLCRRADGGNEAKQAKLKDFVSRLKGHINLLGIDPPEEVDPETKADGPDGPTAESMAAASARRVRRAVLLRSLLLKQVHRTQAMFPIVRGERLFQVDPAVLRALLEVERYRHGARSLEAVLTMSELKGRDRFTVASLPADDQLLEHVHETFLKLLHRS